MSEQVLHFLKEAAHPVLLILFGAALHVAGSHLWERFQKRRENALAEKWAPYYIRQSTIRWAVSPDGSAVHSKNWHVQPIVENLSVLHDVVPTGRNRDHLPSAISGGPGCCDIDLASKKSTMDLLVPLVKIAEPRRTLLAWKYRGRNVYTNDTLVNWTYHFDENPFLEDEDGDVYEVTCNRYDLEKIQLTIELPKNHRRIDSESIKVVRKAKRFIFEPEEEIIATSSADLWKRPRVVPLGDFLVQPRIVSLDEQQVLVMAYRVPRIKVKVLANGKRQVDGWLDTVSWRWEVAGLPAAMNGLDANASK